MAAFSNTTVYGLVSSGSGYFQLPLADFSGKCNENNFLKFERNFKKKSCVSDLTFESNASFINQCQAGFSVRKYVNDLYIGR